MPELVHVPMLCPRQVESSQAGAADPVGHEPDFVEVIVEVLAKSLAGRVLIAAMGCWRVSVS